MIKTSNIVEEIVQEDGFILEAIQRGLINLRAYAKQIQPSVEERAKKPVQIGTINTALFRLEKSVSAQHKFKPHIEISSFSVISNLTEITYDKTEAITEKINTIPKRKEQNDFFTVTEGHHEVTILCDTDLEKQILTHTSEKPKVILHDLVAISVRIPASYMNVPNTIYSLVGMLALRQINLIEIISTYTELSFIINKSELEQTIKAIDSYTKPT